MYVDFTDKDCFAIIYDNEFYWIPYPDRGKLDENNRPLVSYNQGERIKNVDELIEYIIYYMSVNYHTGIRGDDLHLLQMNLENVALEYEYGLIPPLEECH